MTDRMTMWANTDKVETEVFRRAPALRALVYDRMMPSLRQQFEGHELAATMTVDQAFPAPAGLDNARTILLQRKQQREKAQEEARKREGSERKT